MGSIAGDCSFPQTVGMVMFPGEDEELGPGVIIPARVDCPWYESSLNIKVARDWHNLPPNL